MAKTSKAAKRRNPPQPTPGPSRSRPGGSTPIVIPWTNLAGFLKVLTIMGAVIWIFSPAFFGQWLIDDDLYVTSNPLLQNLAGLEKIWFHPGSFVEYYPIEETVLWAEWHLFGMETLGYHLVNVLLHILGALLVWRLLSKFGLRWAWLGGLLFAIHPVQVESVAWISELKNTLSLPAYLLAMCAWVDYEERGKTGDYLKALAWFTAGMLCKLSMAPFPMVILLYAWWKRGGIGWKDIKGSAPFFILSLILGVTLIQSGGYFARDKLAGPAGVPLESFLSRLALAGLSISFYFWKCIAPFGVLPMYPQWKVNPPSPVQFLPWLVIAGALCVLWRKRRSWGRHGLLGFGFFLLFLAPFVGFTQASYMRFTWVMDHFLYLPIIGLLGLFVAGLGRVTVLLPKTFRPFAAGAMGVAAFFIALESHAYAAVFTSLEAMSVYTLRYNPNAWLADSNLSYVRFQQGRISEALELAERALRLYPEQANVRCNLGNALFGSGRFPEAVAQYREALRLSPNFLTVRNNIGVALLKEGHIPEALKEYEESIRLNPYSAFEHSRFGAVLESVHRIPEAIEQFQLAARLDPNDADTRKNLERLQSQQNPP